MVKTSSGLRLHAVNTEKELNDFILLPWDIYKDDPFWVPPLVNDVKSVLTDNPFWNHAIKGLFILYNDNKPIGRIASIIDENHNKIHKEKTGFFGFFDVTRDFDSARLLFDEAVRFVKSKGMNLIRGPVNPSMNDECGFLIEGFGRYPVIMMPYNPKYYLEFVERYGFKKAKDLYAYCFDIKAPVNEKIIRIVERLKKRENMNIRYFNKKKINEELNIIKDIYNSSWDKNWGFVHMMDEEIDYLAKKLKSIIVPEFIQFLEIKGIPVGFSLDLLDYNFVLKRLNGKFGFFEMLKYLWYKREIKNCRLIALGVKKEFQKRGFDAILYYEQLKIGKKLGLEWGELSWVLEDNQSIINGIESMGGKLYKKYRIYEKKL